MNLLASVNMTPEATAAIDTLRNLPGLDVRAWPGEGSAPSRPDLRLEIRSISGMSTYVAEARRSVTSATAGAALDRLAQLRAASGDPPLLLATYVSPAAADRLMAAGFEFADAAGNAYLNGPAAYVLALGNRPERPPASTEFTPADLRLMFALLARPGLTQATYREVAAFTHLSLGKISGTVKKLEAAGYLSRTRDGALLLTDAKRTLERWEFGYLERLRPALKPTGYRALGASGLQHVLRAAADMPGVLLGGEHAAARLTGRLHPSTLTLHVPSGEAKAIAAQLKLARSTEGPTVFLLDRLSPYGGGNDAEVDRYTGDPSTAHGMGLAHPILVRAELLASGDDRSREVAAHLRERIEDALRPG